MTKGLLGPQKTNNMTKKVLNMTIFCAKKHKFLKHSEKTSLKTKNNKIWSAWTKTFSISMRCYTVSKFKALQ